MARPAPPLPVPIAAFLVRSFKSGSSAANEL